MLKRLPAEIVAAIARLAQCNSDNNAMVVAEVVNYLHACDPSLMNQAQRELSQVLYHALESAPGFWQRLAPQKSAFSSARRAAVGQLRVVPNSRLLFLFHGDGHVREAALHALTDAPRRLCMEVDRQIDGAAATCASLPAPCRST